MIRPRAALAAFAFVAAALLTLTACNSQRTVDPPDKPDTEDKPPVEQSSKPTLAVLIIVDQLRGDMPIRWRPLFGKGGFERLASEGAWFEACHYPYATTTTGPGHATCATGCSPDVHGIIANDWYSAKDGKVFCVGTAERYTQVPPLTGPPDKDGPKGISPERLLAPTLGDALKTHTKGKGKVVALSLKDRSAVLPAGRTSPDAVYWADKNGQFVTSTYYRDAVHDWVKQFNASGYVDGWLDQQWTRSRADVDYDKWAGPDDVSGEADVLGMGRTFPHPLSLGKGKSRGKRNYYAAVATSPMGNQLLLDLAKHAIDGEKLGSRQTPDFLSISFSSNDLVGHAYGPDSHEVLDTTLRTDAILRDLMSYLDEKVGKGKWVLALTADHGICPLPEVAKKKEKSKNATRLLSEPKFAEVEKLLDHRFRPKEKKTESQGKWIASSGSHQLYLSRPRLAARGADQAEVAQILAAWMAAQPGIMAAYTRAEIEGPMTESDPILERVKRSYHKDRSGDVTYVTEPFVLMGPKMATGTTHGSPHDYDTHVPLMVIGPGITAGMKSQERVSPELAAVILAKGLEMKAPQKATGEVPKGLFRDR